MRMRSQSIRFVRVAALNISISMAHSRLLFPTSQQIFHLEAFIAKFMACYKEYLTNLFG